jgi:hypothetical protein
MKGKKLLLSAIATILLLVVITIVGNPLFSLSQKNNKDTAANITITNDYIEKSEEDTDNTKADTTNDSSQTTTDIKLLDDTAFSLENEPTISDTVINTYSESNIDSNVNSETNNTENKESNTTESNTSESTNSESNTVDSTQQKQNLLTTSETVIEHTNNTVKNSTMNSIKYSKEESLYTNITYGRISDINAGNATLAISVADPYVNIRSDATMNGEVLGKLYKGAAAAILETKGEWVLIKSGSVKGYINTEYLNRDLTNDEIIEQYGILRISVNTDGLNVRKKMDTESERLTVIYSDEVYPVLDVTDEWVKIKVDDDDITGYVSKEFVNLIVNYNQAISIDEERALLRLQKEEEEKSKQKDSKETLVVQKNSGVSYTAQDLKLLACLVHAESGNQPYEGKLAVANVVLNRVNSSSFPNSIKGVIYESGQFSVVKSGSLDKQLNNFSNYNTLSQKLSIDAARTALEGTNNIGKCLFFNRYSSKKENSLSYSVRIEGHLFWR